MKRALLFASFCLLFVSLIGAAQAKGKDKEPEFLYIAVGPQGQLLSKWTPEVYAQLRKSFEGAGLPKLLAWKETTELLGKAKIWEIPEDKMTATLQKLIKDYEQKFIIAQAISGRTDQGGVRLWIVEEGKIEVKGLWTPFEQANKPPIGAIDSLLLTAMLVYENDDKDGAALVELEKFGSLESILDGYRRMRTKGIEFSRGALLESTQAQLAGKADGALAEAKRAVALDPFWPPNYHQLDQAAKSPAGRLFFRKVVEQALKKSPDNLGLILTSVSRLDPKEDEIQMRKLLDRAAEIEPDNPELIDQEVHFALARNAFESIAGLVRRYYDVDAISAKQKRDFGLKMARRLIEENRLKESLTVFDIVVDYYPLASIFLEKAEIHQRLEDEKGRLQSLLGAFSEMPDEAFFKEIIDAARDSGRTDLAIETLTDTADRMSSDPCAFYTLGLVYLMAGDREEADKALTRAQEEADRDAAIGLYQLASPAIFATPEEYQDGVAKYNERFGKAPDFALLGAWLCRLGKFTAARPILEQQVKEGEPTFETLFDLACCALAVDDFRTFRKAMKKAEDLEGKKPELWGLMLSVWYGKKTKAEDLDRILETCTEIQALRKKKKFVPDFRVALFAHHLRNFLPPEQEKAAGYYLEFIAGRMIPGTLTFKLTEK